MTTEERFTRIENALQHAAELHAGHAENIGRLQRMQEGLVVVVGKIAEAQRDLTQAQRQATEAQRQATEAQRQAAEAQRQINEDFQARLNALLEAQRETERKLQRWLEQRNNGHSS